MAGAHDDELVAFVIGEKSGHPVAADHDGRLISLMGTSLYPSGTRVSTFESALDEVGTGYITTTIFDVRPPSDRLSLDYAEVARIGIPRLHEFNPPTFAEWRAAEESKMSNYRQVHRSRRTEEATAESDELPPHLRKLENRLLRPEQPRSRESKLKGWHTATITSRSRTKGRVSQDYFAELQPSGISVIIDRSSAENFRQGDAVSVHLTGRVTNNGAIAIADLYRRIAGSQQHTVTDSSRELGNRPGGSETIDGVIGANGKYISRGPLIPEGEGLVNLVKQGKGRDPVTWIPEGENKRKIVILEEADSKFYVRNPYFYTNKVRFVIDRETDIVCFSRRYQPAEGAVGGQQPQPPAQIASQAPVPKREPVTGIIEHTDGRVFLRPDEGGNKILYVTAKPADFTPGSKDSAIITERGKFKTDFSQPGFYGLGRK